MKYSMYYATALAIGLLMTACGSEDSTTSSIDTATVELSADYPDAKTFLVKNRENDVTGIIGIRPNESGGVQLVGYVENIPEGPHGMHFHVKADCTAPDFKSSGGHINPMGRQHGLDNPDGPDNADMPNGVADGNDVLRINVINERISFNGEGGLPALLDADGSALVIHENEDDQMTQPIGGAGARIACAEIK